jgi:hypothetical protein
MSGKRVFTTVLFVWICFTGFSQNVYEWYQDGVIVFQFVPEKAPRLPMLNERDVDFQNIPFLSHLAEEYQVSEVFYLYPDLYYPNLRDKKLKNTLQIEFQDIQNVDRFTKDLESFPFIEYAEKKELHVHFLTPNDQYFNSTNQWSLFKINAQQAWDISTGSSSVVVAVTDNAILTTHPDLTNKLVAGWDAAQNDNNPNPTGGNNGAHGTHVSGTVGSQTNNSIGVASIGFNVSVMPVKIGRDSDGALTAGYEGITWAANNGAHVINMSWGGSGYSTYGQNVVNSAWNQGSILVAAAGNDNVSTVFYPAGYNNVVSVAATGSSDAKASFSQYGTWIDISAPGSNIASTVPASYASSGYANMSGTSMASPHVAGLLGLMKSANPAMSNTDLINCLYSSSVNINAQNPNYINQLGHGRIDAFAAVQCVTASAAQFDAGIDQILQPTGSSCISTINPVVVLKNSGSDPLTSVTINYQIVGQQLQTQAWTGNLASGATATINLPAMTTPNGLQVFRAFTSNPNGQTDQNPFNDEKTMNYGAFTSGIPIPFSEDFESGNFSANMWNIENPDNGITWQIYSTQGTTPGNQSAGINFFSYATIDQRDGLISPPLNFSGFGSVEMTFEHAYRRYDQSNSDSLIIYVSDNCGLSWTRVFHAGENGTGTFATVATSTTNFIPAQASDWCHTGTVGSACYTIDLTPWAGQPLVQVKFEGFNHYGNNLYIDNINIDGDVVDYDIGITQILHPSGIVCQGNVVPRVVLHNFGGSTVTSAQISYQNSGSTLNTIAWTGSLSSGQSDTINLPALVPLAGQNVLLAYSSLPNGVADQNTSNDATSIEYNAVSGGSPLPFSEDFESGSFTTNDWTIEDPDQMTTWDIYTVQGTTPGNKAAGINFFFYTQTGERDGMITKYLDFSNHTNIWLNFEHAYRRYDQSSSDSLIIYVSDNCGLSWTRVFQAGENGTGTFATVATSTTNFIPAQASDWCHTGTVGASCFSVNLTQWSGNPLVQVKFESFNNYGNNLFIDNINIDGDVITEIEEELIPGEHQVNVYPNPVYDGYVNFNLRGEWGADITLNIYNIIGIQVHGEVIPQGTQLQTIDVRKLPAGTYVYEVQSLLYSETGKLVVGW